MNIAEVRIKFVYGPLPARGSYIAHSHPLKTLSHSDFLTFADINMTKRNFIQL